MATRKILDLLRYFLVTVQKTMILLKVLNLEGTAMFKPVTVARRIQQKLFRLYKRLSNFYTLQEKSCTDKIDKTKRNCVLKESLKI